MTNIECSVDVILEEMKEASDILGGFIEQQAQRAAAEVGFGYVLTTDVPNNYSALREAFELSANTGVPLPISSENSDAVIYTAPSVNGALRCWHDVSHVRRGLTFEFLDELELSIFHLDELEAAGYNRGHSSGSCFMLISLVRCSCRHSRSGSHSISGASWPVVSVRVSITDCSLNSVVG
jgi:hypothetical protein